MYKIKIYIYIIVYIVVFSLPIKTALAEKTEKNIKYYVDPVYKPLYEDAVHPLSKVIDMAEGGDLRAQYILGDLYLKGKGGFLPNIKKSKYWFEESAKQHYMHSFIRLAAIEKRLEQPIKSYKWYILGLKYSKNKNKELYAFIKKQMTELADRSYMNKKDLKKAKALAEKWNKPLKNSKKTTKTIYNQ